MSMSDPFNIPAPPVVQDQFEKVSWTLEYWTEGRKPALKSADIRRTMREATIDSVKNEGGTYCTTILEKSNPFWGEKSAWFTQLMFNFMFKENKKARRMSAFFRILARIKADQLPPLKLRLSSSS